MSIAEHIVAEAASQGIVLYVKDGQLAYVAEQGGFPENLKADIRAHRETIIALLEARAYEAPEHGRDGFPQLISATRNDTMPLSYAQHQVWVAEQLDPGSGRFNMPIVLRLQGLLREDAVQYALDELVNRHEILRTVYARQDDAPVQRVQPPRTVPVKQVDLSALPAQDQKAKLERYKRLEATVGFNIEEDLMLRVCLLRTQEQEVVVLFTMHHIASDGWSMGLLVREFIEYYTAHTESRSALCVPLDLHYADYACWQRQCQENGLWELQLDYWRGQLANAPQGPTLPTDKIRPARPSLMADIHEEFLDRELSARLYDFAAKRESTLFIVMQTAFALLIGRWSGRTDVVLGTPVAGRTQKAVEPLLGLFVNLLALRTRLDDTDTFETLLDRNKGMNLDAFAHQDIPFDLVVDQVQAERDLRVFPLFQAVFNLQSVGREELLLPDLNVQSEITVPVAKFDLEIIVSEEPDGLWVQWKYATDLFETETVTQLARCYAKLLAAIVADPYRNLVALTDAASLSDVMEKRRFAPQAVQVEPLSGQEFVFVEPATETERLMVSLWQQVLGHERISTMANFFDLGGNSLKAMRLATLVTEHFQIEQSVRTLFERATIAELSRHVDTQRRQDQVRITAAPTDRPLPLSFEQQRLWFIDQLNDGSPQYNMPVALRLRGKLDSIALQKSLDVIVKRHAVLRTVFMQTAEGPMQIVQPWSPSIFPVRDLSNLSEQAQGEEVVREVREETAAAFDLGRDRMLRGRLLILSEREHVLVLVVHHIASDGWSMDILRREFVMLYQAFLEGREAELPALEIQYADYAHWQRETFTEQRLEAQWEYWERMLQGAPATHNLPLDKPRPARQQFAGALHRHACGAGLLSDLEAMGKRQDATLFMVLQAAFALLLARWSQEQDIVIGSPVAGRTASQVEALIGFFVNTVVFRLAIAPGKSFRELLEKTRDQVLEAYTRQDIPFEMLVDRLQPERSLSYNPVVQLSFTLQDEELGELPALDLVIDGIGGAEVMTKFDLEVTAFVQDGALHVDWCYATSLFEAATIERIATGFEVLLRAIVTAPERCLHELTVLDADERERVLISFNDTKCDFPADSLVHELFEEMVDLRPDAVAVVYENQSLSYAELNARANRVAHHLLERGVKPDDRVAICVERSADMVIGLLGILKAGGAYVPLDLGYPPERLAHMVRDCVPAALVTQTRILELLPAIDKHVLCLDDPAQLKMLSDQSCDNPDLRALGLNSRHLAYVIYTSGSTGLPKGAMNEHRAVVNRLLWAQRRYVLGVDDRVLQKTPFSFDVSVWEFFLPLLSGAQLIMARPGGHQEPDYLVDLIASAGVTTLHFVPSMLPAFLSHADTDTCRTLRRVLCSGEALPYLLQQQVMQQLPHVELHNLYGPTEAAIDVTSWRCEQGKYENTVPIGRPIANTQIYILDEQFEPVPIGARGELYIGGVGVARGYLNRPELTDERFVVDPFSDTPDARMYKTGDLARWFADGNLEFLGRIDDQVKIHGLRIELGEIEGQLTLLEAVKSSVVLAIENESQEKRLVAYVVPAQNIDENFDDAAFVELIRQSLKRSLADYMVPSAFMILPALPLMANGKVDKKALPAVDLSGQLEAKYVAPNNATETILCEIWQNLLKVEKIGVNDNFFSLGGHSILAMRLASDIAARLHVKISVGALFEWSTVAALSKYIETQEAHSLVEIPVVPRNLALPLSFAQQRLWLIDGMNGGSRQYNMPVALRLRGELNKNALQQAVDSLIKRHEILHTTYSVVGESAVQVVNPVSKSLIKEIDLSELTGALQESRVDNVIRLEASTIFDLSQDLMLRVSLLKLSDSENVLLFTMHHIASDGWSMGVLTKDFVALYSAYSKGQKNPLSPLEIQYADFANWQRKNLSDEVIALQLDYWEQELAGIPAVHSLPLDRARPAQQRFEGQVFSQNLDKPLMARLKLLAQSHDATLFMLLECAFALLLARWSHEDDIVIGTPIAGRTHSQLEPLIGFFVNTLTFRHQLNGEQSFSELLINSKQKALDAYAHQDLPFEMLVEKLQPTRSLSYSPLFQVLFTLQNNEEMLIDLPGLTIEGLAGAQDAIRFDLELVATESESGLSLSWTYACSLFDASTIERMSKSFEVLLSSIVAEPSTAIYQLELTPDEDKQQLALWSRGNAGKYSELCLHQLFELKVVQQPDAIAVTYENTSLTYQELNERANQVAHLLIEKGVTPDTLVGLHVDRSLEMVVGILAILKSGGAYLPIDPSNPDDRVKYLFSDSDVGIVLTQSAIKNQLPVDGQQLLLLDESEIYRSHTTNNPKVENVGLTPANLAYVIYTSGSTGQPKGVLVEHKNVTRLFDACSENVSFDCNDVWPLFHSYAFDFSVWEIWGALLHGGKLVVVPSEVTRNPFAFNELLQNEKVSVLNQTPSAFYNLVEVISNVDSLRYVLLGGEALELGWLARWVELFGSDSPQLFNAYGPTESTIFATFRRINESDSKKVMSNIGRPLSGYSAYVGAHGKILPIGVPGELHIGGESLARGYLNRDALTKQRFINNTFECVTHERLYKTGDLVRWLPDGSLEYIGRTDDQVKIRGYRIELGEINAHLLRHSSVKDSLVVVHGEGKDKNLVAYVVPNTTIDDNFIESEFSEILHDSLKQTLAAYMVPKVFVVLSAFPLTVNGKLDKRTLPGIDGRALSEDYVAPTTQIETELANVWQDILGVEKVSVKDNFFNIGGSSLDMTRLYAEIKKRYSIDFSLKTLFLKNTISEQAELVKISALLDIDVENSESAELIEEEF